MVTDRTTDIAALPSAGGQANVPGLRRLWLIETRHVSRVVDPRTVPGATFAGWVLPEGGLVLTDDVVIKDWRFSSKRGAYTEKTTTTIQGIQYEQEIKLIVPRDAPQTTLAMMQMSTRKWMCIYTDSNGLVRLVGTPKQPLRFSSQLTIGNNDRQLTWSAITRLPAMYVAEADILSLSALIEYQTDFSRI